MQQSLLFAITVPPYSSETIKALRLARQRGAQLALVSDSELVGPNIAVDHFLQVATQSTHPFGCFGGAFAVLDCLLAQMFHRGGAPAQARVAAYQALRDDTGAYWSDRTPRLRTGRTPPPRR